jgi:hydrogenase nickel incorporation protein HypA/HybF
MHELLLARAVIDAALRQADHGRVTAVHLRVGHLRQVVPASLRFSFEHAARGTSCEGARLTFDEVPAPLRCAACGHGWDLHDLPFRRPACDAAGVEVVEGDEFEVDWVSVT